MVIDHKCTSIYRDINTGWYVIKIFIKPFVTNRYLYPDRYNNSSIFA
jgi:hypothetical protein